MPIKPTFIKLYTDPGYFQFSDPSSAWVKRECIQAIVKEYFNVNQQTENGICSKRIEGSKIVIQMDHFFHFEYADTLLGVILGDINKQDIPKTI
jgi:hypothetical protein